MFGLEYNTTVVLIGTALVGATAGLVGTFAVLRHRALTGDALAHAALPGICVGYLVAGGQNLLFQFLGAFLTGLLSVWIIRKLPSVSRTRSETAVAGVLSVFFGAGIVLSRSIQSSGRFQGSAGFDAFLFGSPGSLQIADIYLIASVCAVTVLAILLTYRMSIGVTFDARFLEVQGLPTVFIDWMHLFLLTITIVVGLPAIGVVMIVALIITPAVTSRLWTDRFACLLLLAAGIGASASAVGAYLSSLDARIPAGATTVLLCSLAYLLSLGVTTLMKVEQHSRQSPKSR